MRRMNVLVMSVIAALSLSVVLPAAAEGPQTSGSGSQIMSQSPRGFGNNLSEMKPVAIAEILKNAKDDQRVLVAGKLTRYLGNEEYEFTDAKGDSITVELDDDGNWSSLAKDMDIEIYADVDVDDMNVHLEAILARPAGTGEWAGKKRFHRGDRDQRFMRHHDMMPGWQMRHDGRRWDRDGWDDRDYGWERRHFRDDGFGSRWDRERRGDWRDFRGEGPRRGMVQRDRRGYEDCPCDRDLREPRGPRGQAGAPAEGRQNSGTVTAETQNQVG